MPVEKPPRVPKLRTHKATGQGYVVLNGRAIYLGRTGLLVTERRYHQVIAEWLAAGQQPKFQLCDVTVKELLARYWCHAREYYRDAAGRRMSPRTASGCRSNSRRTAASTPPSPGATKPPPVRRPAL
ncbi:MAG: hypothetical protein HBSAPP02_21470 [Phycisphaerae bacterium]|nr:MAG: hypothetical protein HRU71_05695 [Planctomycetia bacterium]RIK70840.1 MAG: hypothetical protein DCC66_04180 [Planctomycetota bacterium]GJQ27115.1 MAG: hypothetical protein HBSAPP02_21470 [Phycisphaerae bacterium]